MSIDRTNYNLLTNDDGSNTVGSVWNKAAIKDVLLDPIDAAISSVSQTTTSTGTQNNFALSANAGLLLCNNASLLTLTGLAAGYDCQILDIVAIGAGQVDLANQNTSSTAANRLINTATATISLSGGSGSARLRYDASTARWRVLSHEQGAWITRTFNAGDYTANGSMTWTVGSGDVTRCAYLLRGRALTVSIYLATTTVGGTPSTALKILVPGGFTITNLHDVPIRINDNGTNTLGFCEANGTTMDCYKSDLSNWTAATNTTYVTLNATFEVT